MPSPQQIQIVSDNSTLTNFKAWAKAISDWFRTCGWTNTSDTGQVDWSTLASVPSSSWTAVWETFQPGDGGTNFIVKVEYGYSTTGIGIRFSMGTATNGAGAFTGVSVGPVYLYGANSNTMSNTSSSTQYECSFSGDTGRISIMMWRNTGNWAPNAFCIERLFDSSGTATTEGAVIYTVGSTSDRNWCIRQAVLRFGAAAQMLTHGSDNGGSAGTAVGAGIFSREWSGWNGNASSMRGYTAAFPLFPMCGKLFPAAKGMMTGFAGDYGEGEVYSIADSYGVTRNYLFSKGLPFQNFYSQDGGTGLFLRFD